MPALKKLDFSSCFYSDNWAFILRGSLCGFFLGFFFFLIIKSVCTGTGCSCSPGRVSIVTFQCTPRRCLGPEEHNFVKA